MISSSVTGAAFAVVPVVPVVPVCSVMVKVALTTGESFIPVL